MYLYHPIHPIHIIQLSHFTWFPKSSY